MNELVTPELWGMSDPIAGPMNDDEIGTFDTNYIKYFWNLKKELNCSDITKLIIPYIDRGVRHFIDFATVIKDTFPKLQELYVEQNYCPRHDTTEEFLEFLKILQLHKITFIDAQSSFTGDLTEERVKSVVPKGSKYLIRCLHNEERTIVSDNY